MTTYFSLGQSYFYLSLFTPITRPVHTSNIPNCRNKTNTIMAFWTVLSIFQGELQESILLCLYVPTVEQIKPVKMLPNTIFNCETGVYQQISVNEIHAFRHNDSTNSTFVCRKSSKDIFPSVRKPFEIQVVKHGIHNVYGRGLMSTCILNSIIILI